MANVNHSAAESHILYHTSTIASDTGYSLYDECFRLGKKVTRFSLHEIGYRLTARFVVANDRLKVYELLREDNAAAADLSFLVRDIKFPGVIVTGGFREHHAKLISPSSRIIKGNSVHKF